MATLKTNLIEPEGATTTLTVGEAGGDLVIGADSLKVNTLKSYSDFTDTVTSFTSTGNTTWTAPAGVTSVEYLVVAGGGSGGGNAAGTPGDGAGGGGGAGGYRAGTLAVVAGTSYSVTVGAGGVAGSPGGTAMQGADSVFSTITSAGGGAGGGGAWPGPSGGVTGGSGGGGAGWYTAPRTGGSGNSPATSPRQGFPGGSNPVAGGPDYASGSGGGGSASAGRNGSTVSGQATNFSAGGAGTTNNITGSYVTYAAGGRGAGYQWSGSVVATANSGDGGDGNATRNGGSGIVVVKYTLPTGAPNTLFVSNGSGVVSSVDSGFGGDKVLWMSQTASSSSSVDFTTGIDSTYDEYVFEYFNVHPEVSNKYINALFSTDGGSSYGIAKTTTAFTATNTEADSGSLQYDTGWDLAQGTGWVRLSNGAGNDNDMCIVGELHLFTPSNTTYVKQFYNRSSTYEQTPMATDAFIAGYINTTSAVNAVRFQISGNAMDDGTINMYGIK